MSQSSLPFKPIRPIATVLNHLRLIVIVTAIGTALLATLVLLKVRPTYVAHAGLEVKLLHSRILVWDQEKQFSSRTQYTDYVNTLVRYIVSERNLTRALERMDLPNEALIPADDSRLTIFRLAQMINVQAIRNTHLISISVEGDQPKDLDTIVNAVVDSFMEWTQAKELGQNDTRTEYLRSELARKREELDEHYARLLQFSQKLGTLSFEDDDNPHDRNIEFYRQELNEAVVARLQAEHHLQALKETAQAADALGLDPLVEEFVYQDPSTVEMKNLTFKLREELNRQATRLKPSHPSNKRLREFADTAQGYLEESLGDARETASDILYGKQEIDQKMELAQAENQLLARRELEAQLTGKLGREKELLQGSASEFLTAQQTRQDIVRLSERISEIESRIEELVIEAREPGRVKIQSRATEPIFPQRDRRKIMLVLTLLMSLASATFLAFAIDFLDNHIVDPSYLALLIGQRPTGVLPNLEGVKDFGQLLREHPEGYHADQFRRMMPKIFSVEEGVRDRIFTVTAIGRNAGSTSLALNTMTHHQNIGRKVGMLTVARQLEDLPARTATWDTRESDLQLADDLARFFPLVMNVDDHGCEYYRFRDPCGKEALSNQEKVQQLVQDLARRNERLLIDAPPLLEESEAELLCRSADVVILVVSPEQTNGEVKRAMALLEELGVRKCAVVANNMPFFPGGAFSKAIAEYEHRNSRDVLVQDILKSVRRAAGLS